MQKSQEIRSAEDLQTGAENRLEVFPEAATENRTGSKTGKS